MFPYVTALSSKYYYYALVSEGPLNYQKAVTMYIIKNRNRMKNENMKINEAYYVTDTKIQLIKRTMKAVKHCYW